VSPYVPPPPSTYRLPSLSNRLGWGLLRSIPIALLYLGWPYATHQLTERFGIPYPFSYGTILLFGVALLVLSLARYLSKATRLYGPVSAVYALALLGYLLWLAGQATATIRFQAATISVTFSMLLLLGTVIPLLILISAFLTSIEDAARPGERYPYDFPV
jgi:hypothetical protein